MYNWLLFCFSLPYYTLAFLLVVLNRFRCVMGSKRVRIVIWTLICISGIAFAILLYVNSCTIVYFTGKFRVKFVLTVWPKGGPTMSASLFLHNYSLSRLSTVLLLHSKAIYCNWGFISLRIKFPFAHFPLYRATVACCSHFRLFRHICLSSHCASVT